MSTLEERIAVWRERREERRARDQKSLEAYLVRNLDCLEHCAAATGDSYSSLQRASKSAPPAFDLAPDEIGQLAPPIEAITRSVLGVDGLPEPRRRRYSALHALKPAALTVASMLGYNLLADAMVSAADLLIASTFGAMMYGMMDGTNQTPYYAPNLRLFHLMSAPRLINLGRPTNRSIAGDVSHEYTHFIQDCKTDLLRGYRGIAEGHARGVERIVCSLCAAGADRPYLSLDAARRTAQELKHGYLSACAIAKKTPNAAIAKSATPTPCCASWLPLLNSHCYCLGTSVMRVAEETHGWGVYRRAIAGDLSFLGAA